LATPFFYAASRRQDDAYDQERNCCFFCLSGWVFVGSLNHDGEEVFDVIGCRKCGGTGRISF
jgi:hypothetical protein